MSPGAARRSRNETRLGETPDRDRQLGGKRHNHHSADPSPASESRRWRRSGRKTIGRKRHTAHRIFERLRDEHGFTGGYTIVKDYVRSRRQSTREAFVPLHHPPGHAQVDFGETTVEVGGRREKVAFFCLILPHSNVWFVKTYPRETTEAFLGGVPRSILYDNTTLAVARILGDGTRRRTQAFTHLQSHYLFRDRFGRPGKCPKDTRHRQVKYLNNVVEADHGKLKLLIRPQDDCECLRGECRTSAQGEGRKNG